MRHLIPFSHASHALLRRRQAEAMAGNGQEAEAVPIFRRAIKMSPALARILGHS